MVDLTEKEKAAIEELRALALRWPASLSIGASTRTESRFMVWKFSKKDSCSHGVAQIPRIKNEDGF